MYKQSVNWSFSFFSYLANLNTKELNKILKDKPDLPADSKKKIKEVRRTLKNRYNNQIYLLLPDYLINNYLTSFRVIIQEVMQGNRGTKRKERKESFKSSVMKQMFVTSNLTMIFLMLFHTRLKHMISYKKNENIWPKFKIYRILLNLGWNGLKERVLIYQVSHSIVRLHNINYFRSPSSNGSELFTINFFKNRKEDWWFFYISA